MSTTSMPVPPAPAMCGLTASAWTKAMGGLFATGVVGVDLWASSWPNHDGLAILRVAMVLAAVPLFLVLARGDRFAVGLRVRPAQPVWFWVKAALISGAAIGVLLVVVGAIVWWTCPHLRNWQPPPQGWETSARWVDACVKAPLLEEGVYRFVLCVAAVSVVGRWPTVVLSGLVFAALHVVYGNPSPDNAVAGFLFGWAFLRSGSILVPIILHGLGNACVGVLFLAADHWGW